MRDDVGVGWLPGRARDDRTDTEPSNIEIYEHIDPGNISASER